MNTVKHRGLGWGRSLCSGCHHHYHQEVYHAPLLHNHGTVRHNLVPHCTIGTYSTGTRLVPHGAMYCTASEICVMYRITICTASEVHSYVSCTVPPSVLLVRYVSCPCMPQEERWRCPSQLFPRVPDCCSSQQTREEVLLCTRCITGTSCGPRRPVAPNPVKHGLLPHD